MCRDITKVAAVKGIQIGQEVVLRDNISWFIKNRIMLVVVAFVLGIILTEVTSTIVSFGTYRGGMALLVGGILTLIVLIVSWIRKPRYLFRIEQIERGERHNMTEPGLEEMLELIWTMKEDADKVEKDLLIKKMKLPGAENMLKTLTQEDFVKITDTKVEFTNKGMTDARLIIRRHRLAERLLNDVLAVKEDTMDSSACKFEHFLDEEVTTSICTLLGHPVSCPHGKAIPPGGVLWKGK